MRRNLETHKGKHSATCLCLHRDGEVIKRTDCVDKKNRQIQEKNLIELVKLRVDIKSSSFTHVLYINT